MPATMSNTKWLPVATTASAMAGPQRWARTLTIRFEDAAAIAMPTANAKPTLRLGTAASSL